MKDILVGLLVILLAVTVIVGGYYLGIVLAIFSGLLVAFGVVVFIIFAVTYAIWDLFQTRKRQRLHRDP